MFCAVSYYVGSSLELEKCKYKYKCLLCSPGLSCWRSSSSAVRCIFLLKRHRDVVLFALLERGKSGQSVMEVEEVLGFRG